jgi:hypothetical protein
MTKAWTTSLNFSNVLSVFEYLIWFTKRELKMWKSEKISALLVDKKTSFSSNSAIFHCLDAVNDESALMIALRVKLRYAIEVKYFLDRSRSRLIDSMRIIESIAKWLSWSSMSEIVFDDWSSIESMIESTVRFADVIDEDIFDDDDEF